MEIERSSPYPLLSGEPLGRDMIVFREPVSEKCPTILIREYGCIEGSGKMCDIWGHCMSHIQSLSDTEGKGKYDPFWDELDATDPHRLQYPLHSDDIGTCTEHDFMCICGFEYSCECFLHLEFEFFLDLFTRPVVVSIILYLFEVRYCHSSSVREDIWDDRDATRK
jgi:hypothetical protein